MFPPGNRTRTASVHILPATDWANQAGFRRFDIQERFCQCILWFSSRVHLWLLQSEHLNTLFILIVGWILVWLQFGLIVVCTGETTMIRRPGLDYTLAHPVTVHCIDISLYSAQSRDGLKYNPIRVVVSWLSPLWLYVNFIDCQRAAKLQTICSKALYHHQG